MAMFLPYETSFGLFNAGRELQYVCPGETSLASAYALMAPPTVKTYDQRGRWVNPPKLTADNLDFDL